MAISSWCDRVERSELCRIEMKLDKTVTDRHIEAVKELTNYDTEAYMRDGDDLYLDYEFCIEYFNDVVANLQAVNALCNDPAVILSANCALLEEGQCLAFEVMANLKQVIQTIKER